MVRWPNSASDDIMTRNQRYCIVENFGEFGEYAWIRQNFTRHFSKHSRRCSSVSEYCYSSEWLVFRIEYSMVLD